MRRWRGWCRSWRVCVWMRIWSLGIRSRGWGGKIRIRLGGRSCCCIGWFGRYRIRYARKCRGVWEERRVFLEERVERPLRWLLGKLSKWAEGGDDWFLYISTRICMISEETPELSWGRRACIPPTLVAPIEGLLNFSGVGDREVVAECARGVSIGWVFNGGYERGREVMLLVKLVCGCVV